MRVGIEVFKTSVSHSSSSVTFTIKYYTQNQWRYDDLQSLSLSGSATGTIDYNNTSGTNSSGGGAIYRGYRKYTYTYSTYGSSPGSRTFSATVSGAYNGVTPSVSVTSGIPTRPYDNPAEITGADAVRVSDTASDLSWTNYATAGEPYDSIEIRRWDNISNGYQALVDVAGSATTHRDSTHTANRRYRWALRPWNDAGSAPWAYTPYVQTTPNAPTGATVEKSTSTSVIVRWADNATTTNGYRYSTLVEQSVNGGAFTQIATAASGEAGYVAEGLSPGAVYQFRVRTYSTVGAETWSTYATTGTIQLQAPPAAPSALTTTRVNDNEFQFAWTNNPNGTEAPYDALKIQRQANGGSWENAANLGPTITGFTDTTTLMDTRYDWRIRAENAAGASAWVHFTVYQTKPANPLEVKAKVVPGGSIDVTWVNTTDYGIAGVHDYLIRHYKDGVVSAETAVGAEAFTLVGVDPASNYRFEVRVRSTVGYTSYSAWVSGIEFQAATIPLPPSNIRLSSGLNVFDATREETLYWQHNPTEDGSDQTAFQPRVSLDGGATWIELAKEITSNEFMVAAPNTLANGTSGLFSYRSWGVHATPSDWSEPQLFITSATPVITINSPGTSLPTSSMLVEWAYSDAEGTAQAHYNLELLNAGGVVLEQHTAADATNSVQMKTVIQNGVTYILRLQVIDGDGLPSDVSEMEVTAAFVPPAVPDLTAEYSTENGTTVLTLTPTPDDGGVTSLPATGVDIQRRLIVPATGEYGAWQTLAEGVDASATLVDSTAGIAGDSQYRIIAHSAAPSAETTDALTPAGFDDRWVYLSGGQNFTQVCRLMGNIEVRTTTTRDRTLYQFAGRDKPVMYTGEARSRVIEIAGLLDLESSTPAEWESLIGNGGVLLLRDPLGHRIYGSVPEVSIDRIAGGDMYAIAFNITEVHFP